MIDRRRLRNARFQTAIGTIVETENPATHIHFRARDVDIDRVTSVERSRTHRLVGLGFMVGTLDRRINPQHPSDVKTSDLSVVTRA